MRRFVTVGALLALAWCSLSQTRFRRIHPIGQFSNVRSSGEHAHGYMLDLWRVDSSVEGLLYVFVGPNEDAPAATLDSVKYNIRTGALSFKLKMTTGCDVLPGLKMKPAREAFEFSGVLKDETLKGKMTRRDAEGAERSPAVEDVELARRPDAPMLEAASYSEWKEKADELVAEREPRCRGVLGEKKR